MHTEFSTLVELGRDRAERAGNHRFRFRADGEVETDSVSFAQLDVAARAVGRRLTQLAPPGSRVLLSFPPGLAFHLAFFGCLYGGMIAVPAPELLPERHALKLSKVESITWNAAPAILMSTMDRLAALNGLLRRGALAGLTALAVDGIDLDLAGQWTPPPITADSVAYLQYSSGSTGDPKGVVIRHRTVLANLKLLCDNTRRPSEDFGAPRPPVVSWLPLHHNMGLVGSVLLPLYARHDAILLPPLTFVQRPSTWLRTISGLDRADSPAPNFAFELCTRRITADQRAQLDLSGWEVALVGGEAVRTETLDDFAEAFADCGFRREALLPGYGLAESTVMVTGGPAGRGPVRLRVDTLALTEGLIRPVVRGGRVLTACGQVHPDSTVCVVDRDSGAELGPDRVGEILVRGPGVAAGYHNSGESDAFAATVPARPGQLFLRTGDLGFRHNGQLFVTGRAKEVIIIAGANHYPQDIEATVAASHPAVREFGCCAFSVDDGSRENLVVLAEIAPDGPVPPAEIDLAIRAAVHGEHGLRTGTVRLLAPGTLPFTASAKIQRAECRTRFLAGAL
ncbi:fatty acyl-AMP ligase [Crossiella sp. CA198]|uniref:fatty acyl-AMP ligase n=1 Tax=Crossiella sp. CA198 TaxID=3455607 RepID=UPI003F8D393C